MIADDILKAKFAYLKKYEVDPDILFLSHKSYADLLKHVPNAYMYREVNRALTEQKIFDLQIIQLSGNRLGDYFSVRSSESLRTGKTWLERYRMSRIPNPDAVETKPRPDFDDVVIEEIPQFEIDAYQKWLNPEPKKIHQPYSRGFPYQPHER